MNSDKEAKLKEALPAWAVKPNPMNSKMSVIDPMAVIDRLNEVFHVGGWTFETEFISMNDAKMGTKDAFAGVCKGILKIGIAGVHIEQFGGSTNMDRGDALKGSATDALTKIASYLGIGGSIYKGQGNVTPERVMSLSEALQKVTDVTTLEELKTAWESLPKKMKEDNEVLAMKEELKKDLTK